MLGNRAKKWAPEWGVSENLCRSLHSRGCPFQDGPAAVLAWFDAKEDRAKQRMHPHFKAKCEEVRANLGASGALPAVGATVSVAVANAEPQNDADYAEFAQAQPALEAKAGDTGTLEKLKRFREFALFKISKAQLKGDTKAIKDYTQQAMHFSSVIHDEELRAHRLGRELGEIIQRNEVEGFLYALAYWQLRCVDEYTATIIPKLIAAGTGKPLDRDAIVEIVEPPLLDARIVKPMERATKTTAGTALPPWFLACIEEAMNRTVERT